MEFSDGATPVQSDDFYDLQGGNTTSHVVGDTAARAGTVTADDRESEIASDQGSEIDTVVGVVNANVDVRDALIVTV